MKTEYEMHLLDEEADMKKHLRERHTYDPHGKLCRLCGFVLSPNGYCPQCRGYTKEEL